MKPSILEKLQQLSDRLEEVTSLLGHPADAEEMLSAPEKQQYGHDKEMP